MQIVTFSAIARTYYSAALLALALSVQERSATAADTTAPELTGCPNPTLSLQCYGDVPPPAEVTAVDNVDGPLTPVFSETQSNPASSCNNVITRTWRVTDTAGNSASCSQVIRVNDITAPELTGCPVPIISVQCYNEVPPPANVTASDNCVGPMTPVFSESQSNQGSSCNNVITRTWRVTDFCGNSASCSQIIRVNDTTAPELTGCPTPALTITEPPPPANVVASDNCDGPLTPVFTETQTGAACNRVIARTWTATDRCGNSASCSQVITVIDTTPPVLSGCPSATLTITDISEMPPPANVTATDNCDSSLTPVFTEDQTNPGSSCQNVITRTWVATDLAGNSASCSQVITVVDTEAPVVSAISVNPSVLWPPNHTLQDVTVGYTATDNCPGARCVLSVSSNEPVLGPGSGHTDPDWIIIDDHHVQLRAERAGGGGGRVYTITITCTDAEGNISTATAQVQANQQITGANPGGTPKSARP